MRKLFKRWKSLAPDHQDYLFVYLAGLLWAASYLVFTPIQTFALVDFVVVLLLGGATIIGSLVALWGLLINDNLLLERLGVSIIMSMPLGYVTLQLGQIVYTALDGDLLTDPLARINLVFLGLWIFFWLNKRRRYLKRAVREAKQTPTPTEEA